MPPRKGAIPVGPFLEWFDERAARYAKDAGDYGNNAGMGRALEDCGWEGDAGTRRIHRWRKESITGLVDRPLIEDALDRAGVPFWDVYPEVRDPEEPYFMRSPKRFLSEDQVRAAHKVYVECKLTLKSLAGLLWEKHGYANARSCEIRLVTMFREMGLSARRCTATTANGTRCQAGPLLRKDLCANHDPDRADRRREAAGGRPDRSWAMGPDLLREARIMRFQWGMSYMGIARLLIDETPFTSPGWFAKRLARELRPVLSGDVEVAA